MYRASTFIWPDTATAEELQIKNRDPNFRGTYYGRYGNPTTIALEDAVAALEGGFRSLIVPSGLAAIAGAMIALTRCGDHILVVDTCYWNTRNLCDTILSRSGIETTYYDPAAGSGIAKLMRPNTRMVLVEAPGSQTFEMQDIPAIAQAAHKNRAAVVMDNTWATPLFFQPFKHGVDVSVQAATKYLVGHSDAMLGLITTNESLYMPVRDIVRGMGYTAGGDDAFLALRGLRTLAVRLRRHEKSALAVAEWLKSRPEVAEVLHPALPDFPGHALWKRDFMGSSGLFSVVLQPAKKDAVDAFLNRLELFAMGASWGGYESLVKLETPVRTATSWKKSGALVRLHIGLESVEDLISDLKAGFAAFNRGRENP